MCASGEHYVEVAQLGDALLFRVVGLGSMRVSPAVSGLADRVLSGGLHKFAFDMSRCTGTDSTFMGTLVGLALTLKEKFPNGWVCVVNASQKVEQGLENLGAARFLRFKPSLPIEDIEMERLDATSFSQEQRLDVIRKAHEKLVEIDKRNAERFGAFLESLNRELNT